jgi:hypothetical protein
MRNFLRSICGCVFPSDEFSDEQFDLAERQTNRPDLSNIDHVAPELRDPRLRTVLRSFSQGEYRQAVVIQDYLQTTGIEAQSSEAQEMQLGVCLGLTSRWIRLHNRAPEADLVGSELRTTPAIEAARRLQQLYMASKGEADGDNEEANAAGLLAVFNDQRFKVENEIKSEFSGEGINGLLSTGGYYILSLRGLGIGHALCAYRPYGRGREDQYVRVFDPNAGEFRIRTSDVSYFFTALTARYRSLGQRYFGVTGYKITSPEPAGNNTT